MIWDDYALDRATTLRQGGMHWRKVAEEMQTSRNAILAGFARSGRTLPQPMVPMPKPGRPRKERPAPSPKPVKTPRQRVYKSVDWKPVLQDIAWRDGCSTAGCGRLRFKGQPECLGHHVLRLRAEYQEGWMPRLAQITETVSPRRLASAIRDRIETRNLKLAEWSEEAGLPPSSASKAINNPDGSPIAFAKVALYFGFERVPGPTNLYRRRKTNERAA